MERNLASIQVIESLDPVPDAERIEVAKVLGWHVVVEKGQYLVGDKVVYCEIDSLMPKDNPTFDFLESSNWRIRTRKMRGQVSQGICFPLSVVPSSDGYWAVGDDVTEVLRIIKYEALIPACLDGEMKGGFPSFVPKTDEDRVQVVEPLIAKHAGRDFVATEKVDGTSCTMSLNNGEFGVAGRTIEYLRSSENTYWQMEDKYKVEDVLREYGHNLSVQGEIIGASIQGNKYKFEKNERRFKVFNIFDIDTYEYWSHDAVQDFCITHGLDAVDEVWRGPLPYNVDTLVEMSRGMSVLNHAVRREGIVLRPLNEIIGARGGRVSFKAINPDFLLKYNDD